MLLNWDYNANLHELFFTIRYNMVDNENINKLLLLEHSIILNVNHKLRRLNELYLQTGFCLARL